MLSPAIDRYLALRRAVGFALQVDAGLLRDFARFAAARGEHQVTQPTAIAWAAQAPSPNQRERRLGMVRRFAYHARAEEPAHELVARGVFAHKRRRPRPYIFTPSEVRQLLEATARLRPRGSLRPQTYATFFGLLAATGLRVSEARRLVLDDVTPDGVVIRQTKFRKDRLVPLHATTAGALQRYLEHRQARGGGDPHVFLSTRGRSLTYAMVNGTFRFLLRALTPREPPAHRAPRIHDLRHYFAVRALESSPPGRPGSERHMLALSTYLGHAHVSDTYWYLQATPHLMAAVADACEAVLQGGTP